MDTSRPPSSNLRSSNRDELGSTGRRRKQKGVGVYDRPEGVGRSSSYYMKIIGILIAFVLAALILMYVI
jgi:hypothetical protein